MQYNQLDKLDHQSATQPNFSVVGESSTTLKTAVFDQRVDYALRRGF